MDKTTIYIRHLVKDKLPPKTGTYTVILQDPKTKHNIFRSLFYSVENGFRKKNGNVYKDIIAWLEKKEINTVNIIDNENT